MADAPAVLAPAVAQQSVTNFELAMKGSPIPPPPPLGAPQPAASDATATASSATSGDGSATPAISIQNVPDSGGNTVGAEVVSAPNSAPAPGPSDAAPASTDQPPATNTAAPAASGTPESNSNLVATPSSGSTVGAPAVTGNAAATPAGANPEHVYGLAQPVGPNTPAPLPPIDKPAAAADQINDVKPTGQPQVSTGTASGKPGKKNPKPAYHSGDESSSKHHPKKGVDKLNPL